MPVRRQIYKTAKKKKDEMKKIETLLYAYGIIHPGARITLRNDSELVWQKGGVPDVRSALVLVLGRAVTEQLVHRTAQDESLQVVAMLL